MEAAESSFVIEPKRGEFHTQLSHSLKSPHHTLKNTKFNQIRHIFFRLIQARVFVFHGANTTTPFNTIYILPWLTGSYRNFTTVWLARFK